MGRKERQAEHVKGASEPQEGFVSLPLVPKLKSGGRAESLRRQKVPVIGSPHCLQRFPDVTSVQLFQPPY